MFKLLKYEARKTMFIKLALLAVTVIVEALFLTGYAKNIPTRQGACIIALGLIGLFGIVFMGIQSIIALHRDMNTRQSYMLFMTPNSTYSILGAKVLENTITTLIAGAFYVGLVFFDVKLVLNRDGDIGSILDFLTSFLESYSFDFELTFAGVASFAAYNLCSWVATVTTAYLADVIASSLLNGKKGGGLISALLFFALTRAIFRVVELLPGSSTPNTNNYIQCAYNLIIAALCYIGTAKLMDKYLSV